MSAAGPDHIPVRADLADVTPLYYPIVEHKRFGSIKAMCMRMGWAMDLVRGYVDRALVERSEFVVIDRLVLGDPKLKVCAILVMQAGGAVILCAGLFAEASEDAEAVRALADQFAASPEFSGKFIGVGEFRGNRRGALQ